MILRGNRFPKAAPKSKNRPESCTNFGINLSSNFGTNLIQSGHQFRYQFWHRQFYFNFVTKFLVPKLATRLGCKLVRQDGAQTGTRMAAAFGAWTYYFGADLDGPFLRRIRWRVVPRMASEFWAARWLNGMHMPPMLLHLVRLATGDLAESQHQNFVASYGVPAFRRATESCLARASLEA